MSVPLLDKTNLAGGPCGKSEENRTFMSQKTSRKPGIIVYWTGTIAAIPSGWALCNGAANAAGSGLALITDHPFSFLASTNAGSYRSEEELGSSEPHANRHVGVVTPASMEIEVESAKTNIRRTELDGAHTHPFDLSTAGGEHSHGGGGHDHKLNVYPAAMGMGDALGADEHEHDNYESSDDNLDNHLCSEVAAHLDPHRGIFANHAHNLEEDEVTLDVVETGDKGNASVADKSFGDNDDSDGILEAPHEAAANAGVAHARHTHNIVIGDFDWVHSHPVPDHEHDAYMTGGIHGHYGGGHSHEYEMDLSKQHKHIVTDTEHTHTGEFIDVHTHTVFSIGDDDGHTHRVTVAGEMLVPIEDISSSSAPGAPGGGGMTPYTCSESEDRRNFVRCANEVDGLPAGIIIMWSRPANTIPAGWGIADGAGNRSGSGFNVVDSLIVHTGWDLENGERWNINPPEGGEHSHEVLLVPRTFNTHLDPAETNIGNTDFAGSHRHDGTLSGDLGSHTHIGGDHDHVGTVVPEGVWSGLDGDHDEHSASSEPGHIENHDCEEFVDCVAPHPDHTHAINTMEIASGGGVNIRTNGLRTGGVVEANVLGHYSSGHADIVHQYEPGGHVHGATLAGGGSHRHLSADHAHHVEINGEGEHRHVGGYHKHDVVDHLTGSHLHGMSDPMHTHPIEVDLHTHVGYADDGMHVHEQGLPKRVYLIPIEKLP